MAPLDAVQRSRAIQNPSALGGSVYCKMPPEKSEAFLASEKKKGGSCQEGSEKRERIR